MQDEYPPEYGLVRRITAAGRFPVSMTGIFPNRLLDLKRPPPPPLAGPPVPGRRLEHCPGMRPDTTATLRTL